MCANITWNLSPLFLRPLETQFMFDVFGFQMVKVTLLSIEGGGRIDPNTNVFSLRILPNDNPHGTIEFVQTSFTIKEFEQDASQYITVNRLYVFFLN